MTTIQARQASTVYGFAPLQPSGAGSAGEKPPSPGEGSPGLTPFREVPIHLLPTRQQILAATEPRAGDNQAARGLKSEYRDLFCEIAGERQSAQQQAATLGQGVHTQPNGDEVSVSRFKDGLTTVTTRRADGSTRSVTYNDEHPNQTSILQRDARGNERQLEQDGDRMRDVRRNPLQEVTRDEYFLHNFKPGHTHESPTGQVTTTVANPNGSTDAVTHGRGGIPGAAVRTPPAP